MGNIEDAMVPIEMCAEGHLWDIRALRSGAALLYFFITLLLYYYLKYSLPYSPPNTVVICVNIFVLAFIHSSHFNYSRD